MPPQAAPFSTWGDEDRDGPSLSNPPQETPPVQEDGEQDVGRDRPVEHHTPEEDAGSEVSELSGETDSNQPTEGERDPTKADATTGDVENNSGSDDTSTQFALDDFTESKVREFHRGVGYVLVLDQNGRYQSWLPYDTTVEGCKAHMRACHGNGFTFIYIDSDGHPTKELFIVDDNAAYASKYSDAVAAVLDEMKREDEDKIRPIDLNTPLLPITPSPGPGGHDFTRQGGSLFESIRDSTRGSDPEDNSSDTGNSGSDDQFDWDSYLEWLSTDEGMQTAGGANEHH